METRADFAARFHPAFAGAVARLKSDVLAISADPCLEEAYGQTLRLAEGKAKRIRPYVASLLYRDSAKSESDEAVLPALVAIEAFHLFALVHDDIMDEADERYGIATVHAHVRERERARLGDREADLLGRAHAILVGDGLLNLVHDLFLQLGDGPVGAERAHRAHKLLVTMSREIVTGQHLDVAFTVRDDCATDDIIRRHHLKTALYTFARPMQIGAVLGGAPDDTLAFCQRFGSGIGVGFQLEDDLLDVLGDESATGKRPCIDLTQRQHTLLTQHVKERGTPAQQATLARLWGQPLSAAEVEEAKEMFTRSGAVDAVRAEAMRAFERAETELKKSPLAPGTAAAFGDLVAFLRQRLP
jgi:geranylgeranyl diphosphate synthase type I